MKGEKCNHERMRKMADKNKTKKVGEATVGVGSPNERTIDIIEITESEILSGGRQITIAKLVDGSYAIKLFSMIDNNRSEQEMWLTLDSMVMLASYSALAIEGQNIDEIVTRLHKIEKVNGEVKFKTSNPKFIKKNTVII